MKNAKNLKFYSTKDELLMASQDFGHLITSIPEFIARPVSSEEIQALINYAKENGFKINIKSYANSQSGQALAYPGCISMDLSRMPVNILVDDEQKTVTCSALVSWKNLLNETLKYGLIPPVIPLNTNLSVGGTLSIAGMGSSSHMYGTAASSVKALEFITGNGDTILCNRQQHSRAFHGALANLGRCGIIQTASLSLQKTKPYIRTLYLLYDDLEAWVHDQQYIHQRGCCIHMQGSCAMNNQGLRKGEKQYQPYIHWFYTLQLSYEYSDEQELWDSNLLENLHYYKYLHAEHDKIENFLARYDSRFALMKSTGMEKQVHPWFECLVPAKSFTEVLPTVLQHLSPVLGDNHRLFFLAQQDLPALFMVPQSESCVLFAILPVGVPPHFLPDALQSIEKIHKIMMEIGGKRYLSGWLGMMKKEDWKNHYAHQWILWNELKAELDPENVFSSYLFRDFT